MRSLRTFTTLLLFGILLFSCEKKNSLQDDLKKNGVSFKQLVADKYTFEVDHIVGESSGQVTIAQVGNYNYITKDYGETWEKTSLPTGAKALTVSTKGRIIYEHNHTKYLYAETGTITFADQGDWRHYYLDSDDNVFYTKIAFSAGAVSELFIAPSGKSFWEKIEPPTEGLSFEYIGVHPDGGIAFLNTSIGAIQHYLPGTKKWQSFSFSTKRSISTEKTFMGQDGNFYLADNNGFDKITTSGITSSAAFPDSMLNYLNPIEIQVSKEGTVFALLTTHGQFPSLFTYKNSKWDLFKGDLATNVTTGIRNYYIAENTILYPGRETTGDLLNGVAFYNMETQETNVSGAKDVVHIPSLVYQTKKGKILLSYPNDKYFYEYTGDKLLPLDVFGITDIYEAPNGMLYLLSADALTLMDANLSSHTKVEGIFSQNGFQNQNGFPTSMVMQQLNDGTFALIGTLSYNYNVGGTGFNTTVYANFMLKSNDGLSWIKADSFSGTSGKPSVIDKNGVIFFDQINSYAGQSETHIPVRSDDGGTTWTNIDGYLPSLITSNGHFLHPFLGSSSNSLFIFDGNEWKEYAVNLEEGQLLINQKISGSDKLILVTREGVFISQQSFSIIE